MYNNKRQEELVSFIWDLIVRINDFEGFYADMLTSFVPVFLGIWLSIRYALGKFVTEKWWERKAEAYESVISATYQSFRYFDEHLHAAQSGTDVDAGVQADIKRNSEIGDDAITEALIIGKLKLSKEFHQRLKKLQVELTEAGKTVNWTEYLDDSYVAYTACLEDLERIAKIDLGIKS